MQRGRNVHTDSLLSGENAAYVDELYQAWLREPASVAKDWAALFETWDRPVVNGDALPGSGPSFRPSTIFRPPLRGVAGMVGADQPLRAASKQARVAQLVNAYRVRGHMLAKVDPLGERERVEHPELTLEYYGLSKADLELTFATAPLYGLPEFATLREILDHCQQAYSSYLASEYMNINVVDQKQWVAQQLESLPGREMLNRDEELLLLRRLCDAENFEAMLHTRFPGTKRFSLEGGETLIPLLDILIEAAGAKGIEEIVIGMAHRGRLNTLANVMDKPVAHIVAEFEDVLRDDKPMNGGDVKYHLGYSSEHELLDGGSVHLSLTPNPSHLEAVNPVVQGRVRAKQDALDDGDRSKRMAVLVHGDAAFAGQGVVAEILQGSELRAYHTGGTIHVVVNNQIGFTTQPSDGRSGPYASDMARMLGVPIFHVNGESPRAVAAAVKIAVAWRQTFQRDVVIDMYCYRKYGHNEGDEPAYTQPTMYKNIRKRSTPRQAYAEQLQKIGYVSAEEAERIALESRSAIDAALDTSPAAPKGSKTEGLASKGVDPDLAAYARSTGEAGIETSKPDVRAETEGLKGEWSYYTGSIHDEADTTYPKDRLAELLVLASTVPEGFKAHRKVLRLFEQRREMASADRPIDWAVAEQLAFASLLDAGFGVRMSGQDCGRGTFSHRHAVITDTSNNEEYRPLAHLHPEQGRFEIWDSHLSEYGVLGYEFGYSLDAPQTLVLWEAQFGDFVNGAQIMIDQFIVSSEIKWERCSGLVMLLPHGYEGQGPEHSSARPERFLQSCAQENIQVANLTTPANYFHALRRQLLRDARKPLVLMSPKSLLRSPLAVSGLNELAEGSFRKVIPDPSPPSNPERLVFCTGKIYYELAEARGSEASGPAVALHRVELIHPFPHAEIQALIEAHPEAEVVWCQEEPRNMGYWAFILQAFLDHFPDRRVRYIGRDPAASPAGGSNKADRALQRQVIERTLAVNR
ncbi:MAG: 2-oxoglutarate dehydrogenase E1 component [Deltaproteobacteria bacterium]|nr:MAG: 2-oxoglutarate dehydrogenase E1 component [Deltaproteobacteria bacterium]